MGKVNPPTSAPEFFGFGDIEKPIRINENGEIVFTAWDDQGMRRAYLWLPATNYGFPAYARIDLGDLIPTAEPVAATDLNNGPNGVLTVVGARGNASETENLPYLWQVAGAGLPDHGYLRDRVSSAGELGANGFAYGVTDFGTDVQDPDPYIVGYTKAGEECAGLNDPLDLAFRAKWDGGYTPLNPPLGFMHVSGGPGGSSVALDVAKLGVPWAVGYAQLCNDAITPCEESLTAMAWDDDSGTEDNLPDTISAQARGINDSGFNGHFDIVGFDRTDGQLCTQPGAFWDWITFDPEGLPIELNGNSNHPRTADGVSNLDGQSNELIIVGQNESAQLALAWFGNPTSGWSVLNLNLALNECCVGADSWHQLIATVDVNEPGHIVGYGFKNPNDPDLHYFLLVPAATCTACCGDTNDDGMVDVADLLAVLAAWGPCIGCPEDIDCTREVAVEDLLIVLERWGACPEQPSSGLGMPLETALGAVGFNTVQEFRAWAESATISEVHAMAEVLHLFISPKEGG